MPRSPAALPATTADAAPKPRARPSGGGMGLAIADAGVVLLFLGLTFVLGIFPQHDTDFWWHLRTGDLIRATGAVPRTDWYTFGAEGHSWIDLHWGFQVALSWLYAHGGVNATIAAKCVITTIAVAALLAARRRDWPVWVMTLTFLPALLVLSGRMYVRPETVTLLYLCVDLAILARIDRHPRLAWVLPVVQVFWVNTQGLFAFGPIVVLFALIDAASRRGAFAPERGAWWRTVLAASLATVLACLVNPYGLFGALYPLQLAGTMTSPAFEGILELQSIPEFILQHGVAGLPLHLHLVTIAVGAMSFLVPLLWAVRDRDARAIAEAARAATRSKAKARREPEPPPWRLSAFRLLLFVGFSLLSLKATRNSHQFAAVVGAVTAWNFGEWGAALARRKAEARPRPDRSAAPLIPRLATAFALAGMIALVGTGGFYALAGEGRKVGWGEAPLWFAHDAVNFAGSEGMPARFLTYHNGLAGLFEYRNGPRQKVYCDARLEVMGADFYERDKALAAEIVAQKPIWTARVESLGPPVPGAVIDHVQPEARDIAAAFLGNSSWRCVFYDATASVHLHDGANPSARAVDFAARHFGLDPTSDPSGSAALALESQALWLHSATLMARASNSRLAGAMAILGKGYARRALALDPSAPKVWRTRAMLEALQLGSVLAGDEPRFRLPLDPIIDLPFARATHDLEQALKLAPGDFEFLAELFTLYAARGMHESASELGERLMAMEMTPSRSRKMAQMTDRIARSRAAVRRPARTGWANAGELEQRVTALYADGRARTAADLLEAAYPPRERTWDQADRLATLRLHLGRPDLARAAWEGAEKVPRPALREARLALAWLAQGDMDEARTHYRRAIAGEPGLFEAHYGLAVLERDAGDADACLKAADSAEKAAETASARAAASAIADFARPYAPAVRPAR